MTQRIRTIGFSLLGGGRGNDGMPFVSPSAGIRRQMKQLGAGSFGRGEGEVESDPELEELIASEERSYETQPVESEQMHRAGGVEEAGTEVTPGCEGYYELCVKSVEAVSWDPEAEEETSLSSRMTR